MSIKGNFSSQMAYRDFGLGKTIIIIHGFPFDGSMWDAASEIMRNSYRLIIPDLRGFGRTLLPVAETTTMEQFADDLFHLVQSLQINEPVYLCGLSMGGYVAMSFAQKYPQVLAGLILCDTKAVGDTETMAETRRKRANALAESGMKLLVDAMLPNILATNGNEKTMQFVSEMMLRQPIAGVAAADRGIAVRQNMTAFLSGMACPTLVLCGEHDKISPPSEMREISQIIPHSTFQTIPNAGHLAPLENPEAFASSVKSFL